MTRSLLFGKIIAMVLLLLGMALFSPRAAGKTAGSNVPRGKKSQTAAKRIEHQLPIKLFIDGHELTLQTAPLTYSNLVFIPLEEEVADRLGAILKIDYADGAYVITLIHINTTSVYMKNKTQYFVEGVAREFSEAPFMQSGYLMVPAREFFESLGYAVDWYEDKRTLDARPTATRMPGRAPSHVPSVIPSQVSSPEPAPTPGRVSGTYDTVFDIPYVEPVPVIQPAATATAAVPQAPELPPFEYTFDNTVSFENIAISGAVDQSNFLPTSAIRNLFNIRFRSGLQNGYTMKGTLRTTESSDPIENKGAVEKLSLNFSKGGVSMDLYDFAPKFSYFLLRNYQVRGLRYVRENQDYNVTALAGKSPKILADSEYARMIYAMRVNHSKTRDRDVGINFVQTRDGGSKLAASDQVDNKVVALNADGTYGMNTKLQAEYSLSETSFNKAGTMNGGALSLRSQYRDRQTLCTAIFEKTGTDFLSETSYVTSGRREASALCNKKLNARAMFGGGYKAVRMSGEETRTLPTFFSVEPFKERPALKFSLRRNYERIFGANTSRYLDVKSAGVSDEVGSVGLDVTIERRKQKETGGSVSFRDSYRYRADTFLNDKTEFSLQVKRERRTRGSNPRTRFYRLRIDHELKPWNDMSFVASRYYNGTTNNRTDYTLGFRKIDIVNDREYSIEYNYYNFREHNDNVLRLYFSFYR